MSKNIDTESKNVVFLLYRRNLVRPRARASYQTILQEESHTLDLLSIQIDKYKITIYPPIFHLRKQFLKAS